MRPGIPVHLARFIAWDLLLDEPAYIEETPNLSRPNATVGGAERIEEEWQASKILSVTSLRHQPPFNSRLK